MGFRCGIVGLPNVGKSTLFNALTETAAAQAANYPFCTIEPNVGNVAVPDDRLQKLAATAGSAKIIETQLAFVDIAGLVRGASKGEGLGNQFLGNIREVDAIVHVLRCFEDGDVTHVEGKVDPIADADRERLGDLRRRDPVAGGGLGHGGRAGGQLDDRDVGRLLGEEGPDGFETHAQVRGTTVAETAVTPGASIAPSGRAAKVSNSALRRAVRGSGRWRPRSKRTCSVPSRFGGRPVS